MWFDPSLEQPMLRKLTPEEVAELADEPDLTNPLEGEQVDLRLA